MWQGEPLNGRTLLLHAEQGIGDTIQFMRYVADCTRNGARVVLEVPAPLRRLAMSLGGTVDVLAPGRSLPRFDLHCPLMSLPGIFNSGLGSIPARVPYLRPAADDMRRWRQRIGQHDHRPRVGIAWAGNSAHQNDRHRSINPDLLAPLGRAGPLFYSLQVKRGERIAVPPGLDSLDCSTGLLDFADTAALIDNLDLVISADSAVAHLAGAMGKPVWLLLPFVPDWRWLLNRDDSPWYPTMRLFRQTSIGDWRGVVDRVAAAIRYDLGVTLARRGDTGAAIRSCERSVELNPEDPRCQNNRGICLRPRVRSKRPSAITGLPYDSPPHYAQPWNNLGNALRSIGSVDEAMDAYGAAIGLEPSFAEANSNLCAALLSAGKPEQAIEAGRRAVDAAPDLPSANWNLAWALLVTGDFATGWEEFEWRWKWDEFPTPDREFGVPRWDGQDLTGRTLLLHAEQGLGDVIQFVRYATLCADRGANVVLEVPASLGRLSESIAGVRTVIIDDQKPRGIDFQCPLMSLPRAFGTRLDSVPSCIPYLHPVAEDVRRWRDLIEAAAGNGASSSFRPAGRARRAGLAWAGSAGHENDRNRSIDPILLAPLSGNGFDLYSLQAGRTPPAGLGFIDYTPRLVDFEETAALIENLDLVISVDTAVAHLAGSMGKPVWLLLPFAPDWRWLLTRDDSPWYPTMRLFRQAAPGDWAAVIRCVVAALKGLDHR